MIPRVSRAVIVAVVVLAAAPAHADMMNNEAIRAHVDAVLSRGAPAGAAERQALFASHAATSARVLIPIYGSYILEHQMFGELRPAGIVFDWVLGGFVPIGLAATALATSGRTRRVLAYSALGLYVGTRIGIEIFANLHVSEYNHHLKLRLDAIDAADGKPVPAIGAETRF